MKINPIASTGNTVGGVDAQASRVESVRAMKMVTNATPGPAGPQELPISDDNEDNANKSNAVVEATQPISPQFAALARERRAIQRERQAFEQQKAEFAKSQGSDPAIPLARLKSEPLKVLLESGVTYDQLTEAILANQGNPELGELRAEMKALKEGLDQKFTETQTHEEQRLYKEVDRDAKSIVASKADDFELVNKMGRVPVAVEIWKREFKESGEFPDMEGILRDVEEHCLEECQQFTGLKKIQALFPQSAPQPQQRSQGMRTLTNKDTASVPATAKQRALAAFYGTLKK